MKKIIISEANHTKLIKYILQEETQLDLVKDIKKYLDQFYNKGSQVSISPDGKFTSEKIIGVKTKNNDGEDEVVTNISPTDLFYRLEEEFKNRVEKGEKRNAFLKQCIIDWYNDEITPQGNLSKNLTI